MPTYSDSILFISGLCYTAQRNWVISIYCKLEYSIYSQHLNHDAVVCLDLRLYGQEPGILKLAVSAG